MEYDGQQMFAFMTFGGEGVATDGSVGALLNTLWIMVDGDWILFWGDWTSSSDSNDAVDAAWPQERAGFMTWFEDDFENPGVYVFGGWAVSGIPATPQCALADLWRIDLSNMSFHSANNTGTLPTATRISPQTSSECNYAGATDQPWPSARSGASTWKTNIDGHLLLWMAFGRTPGPNSFVQTKGAYNDVWMYNVSSGTWTEVQTNNPKDLTRPPIRSSASLWAINHNNPTGK